MTPNPMQQIRELAKRWKSASSLETSNHGRILLSILDNPDWVCVPRDDMLSSQPTKEAAHD